MYFESLWKSFSLLPEVEAIALAGSRAEEHHDHNSDYDLYVYVTAIPSQKTRRFILEKNCSYIEMENKFWELEDDCILKNGIDIDILYRNLDDFTNSIHQVILEYQPSNGYSTCFWHNLLHSRILYDPSGKLSALQKEAGIPYPDQLAKNIIERNRKLLSGFLPSYDRQIKKAIERQDMVSINHRTTAWLESYFDILFALNQMTHSGEKRMKERLIRQARKLPDRFEELLDTLLANLYSDPLKALETLQTMTCCLDRLLEKNADSGCPD